MTEAYARHRADLAGACASAGIPDGLPDNLGPGTSDRLANMSATDRDALFARLERVRALDGEIRARGKDVADLETAIAAAEDIVRLEAAPRQDAALTAERERIRSEDRAEHVRSLARDLAPVLATAGIEPAALDADADGTARRIAELGAAYADVRGRNRVLSDAVLDVLPRRAVAIEAEGTAVASEYEAARTAGDLAATLDEARSERAALLGGEPTDTHRARITADRDVARANLGMAREAIGIAADLHAAARGSAEHAEAQCRQAALAADGAKERFRIACDARPIEGVLALLAVPPETRDALRDARDRLRRAHEAALVTLATRQADLDALRALPPVDLAESEAAADRIAEAIAAHQGRRGGLDADLLRDDEARGRAANLTGEIEAARETLACWDMVDAAVGSQTGDKFRRFAQGVTLEHLAELANGQLRILSPRYALARSQGSDLALHVIDCDMDGELRGIRSLSGGERFLVSLALALALSGLEGRQAFVDTLFIDEGFGSLDAETLDVAIDALETLQGQGRRVGVITHVAAMIDRIFVQVRVERRGDGRSIVRVTDGSPQG
jgi:exonuclease SbcC